MKLRFVLLTATILALSPAASIIAHAQTAPVTSAPVAVGGGERMQEAEQRFNQEQEERRHRFEAEQEKRRVEFQARMQEWAQKRAERQAERKNLQPHPVMNGAPTPVAPAPVSPQ